MNKIKIPSLFFLIIVFSFHTSSRNSLINDSIIILNDTLGKKTYLSRLNKLDLKTPMNLNYNEFVHKKITKYLTKEKGLISKMLGLQEYYFPIFEEELDKNKLPLELKYLTIVESALNPQARSKSGASGLWQFMYTTGKEYGLNVTSYKDQRQDPYESTKAACKYFLKLYDMFGDWNLVLAAYNSGPGYIQRKIIKTNQNSYWELRPYLKKETQDYVPLFIAVNYIMTYYKEHNIEIQNPELGIKQIDTITLKQQVEFRILEELLCVPINIITYLNPHYKKGIIPKTEILIIPKEATQDFLLNEKAYYNFILAVEKKEILIKEERIIYSVKEGDYLGKIAKEHDIFIHEIKLWNNLKTTHIDIGDKLVLYVKEKEKTSIKEKKYIIQEGDTLWDIAKKYNGLSVSKIKEYNNLDSDVLKPGNKIVLPIQ